MLAVHIIILLGAIYLGAQLGSIAIGMMGGLGVMLLGFTGVEVAAKDIPFDVIGIIMCVIAAISAMQRAGGLDYLVGVAEKFLRRDPKKITLYAPIVTWLMTILAGTGHTAYSTLPVITEVAKVGKVRPSRPLSAAVVSSQIAIVASPISAAVVFVASMLEPKGVSYLQLLAVMIVGTFLSIFPTAFVANHLGKDLEDDPVYQDRVKLGVVATPKAAEQVETPRGARTSVWIFLGALLVIVGYSILTSSQVGLVSKPPLARNEAIMTMMLATAAIILLVTNVPAVDILNTQVFKSGMSASICVLGVAWLGTAFINHYLHSIESIAGGVLKSHSWLLAVVLFFAACLLYSQAATAKALMPAALAIGVSPLTIVGAFPAVSALFVLPTYPTLLAAVEIDDTGSTRIGKYVFNHSFMIPGVVGIVSSIVACYALGALIL